MSFVDSQNLYLVQEICIFGTLAAIRQQHRLPIEKIRSYSAQILTGIEFMHHYSIVHCDLKPENIMVQTMNSCLRAVSFPPRKRLSWYCTIDPMNDCTIDPMNDFGEP